MALIDMELKLYRNVRRCVVLMLAMAFAGVWAWADEPACRAAQLKLKQSGEDAAMSHREITFTLENRSASACSITGLPLVKLMNGANKALETSKPFDEQPADARAHQIVLKPHQKASFSVRFGTSGPYDPGQCPGKSAKISILTVENTAPMVMNLQADACTPLEVSPLVAQ